MSGLPAVESAADMKGIIILTACQIAEQLAAIGDQAGAYALVTLGKTIEEIPCTEGRA